jgi:GntR family transcriptional regulator
MNNQSFQPQKLLHVKIYESLLEKIHSNEYGCGEKIPSERDLEKVYEASRETVRRALERLRLEGFIYKKIGVGNFISEKKLDIHSRNLTGFTDEMKRRGLNPSSKILYLGREKTSESVAVNLGISEDQEIYRIERLRMVDNEPMAFEIAYLPADKYADLDKINLEKTSLYKILSEQYFVKMTRAFEVLEAISVDDKVAGILLVEPNSPVLVVQRTVYAEDNSAVEFVTSYYRADRYRATFYLTKNGL